MDDRDDVDDVDDVDDTASDVQAVLHVVAEPTRFRIVELLATRPHTVGEVAAGLGALQPQTTKHLQALEAVGVIRVHRLGRRRVARLDRETLARLADYFATLHHAAPADTVLDTTVLDDYQRAIVREQGRLSRGDDTRVLRFTRNLPATADSAWQAWTDPELAAQWWAPRHFTVVSFDLQPHVGGEIRLVLREGDGAEYESRGQVEETDTGRLVFTLAPVDPSGQELFQARHTLTIAGNDPAVATLTIEVSDARPDAAPAIAGLEPGWQQLLDQLQDLLRKSR